jgi:hypothetical protein
MRPSTRIALLAASPRATCGPPPDPPVLPAEFMRKLEEVFGGPHNLMVRAAN